MCRWGAVVLGGANGLGARCARVFLVLLLFLVGDRHSGGELSRNACQTRIVRLSPKPEVILHGLGAGVYIGSIPHRRRRYVAPFVPIPKEWEDVRSNDSTKINTYVRGAGPQCHKPSN